MSAGITQDMAYKQSLMKYSEKYGAIRANWKCSRCRSYSWTKHWDRSAESLTCQSWRPHSHPKQHRGGTETDPGYAPQGSQRWSGRILDEISKSNFFFTTATRLVYQPFCKKHIDCELVLKRQPCVEFSDFFLCHDSAPFLVSITKRAGFV